MVEFGEARSPPQPGVGRPRPYEMATRLSYLLLGSTPDDAADRSRRPGSAEDEGRRSRRRRAGCSPIRARTTSRETSTRGCCASAISRPALDAEPRRGRRAKRPPASSTMSSGPKAAISTRCSPRRSRSSTRLLAQLYGIPGVTGSALPAGEPARAAAAGRPHAGQHARSRSTDARGRHASERAGRADLRAVPVRRSDATPSAEQHTQAGHATPGRRRRHWLARVTAPATCRSCHQTDRSPRLRVRALRVFAAPGATPTAGSRIDARGTIAGHRHRGQLRRRAPAHRPPRAQPRRPCLSRPQVDGDRLRPARSSPRTPARRPSWSRRSRAPAATSATS